MRRRNGNYSINNKKFKPTELHGERFCDWFDKTFNLQPIIAEVKYDTTTCISKSEISTNINAAESRYISEDMLGKAEGEPNKSPSNLVQEQPSGSIPQPTENDMVGEVSFVETNATRVFPASHAGARIFNNLLPHPRCALAIWDDAESYANIDGKDNSNAWQPKTGSSPVHPLSACFTTLQSCNCFASEVEGCIT